MSRHVSKSKIRKEERRRFALKVKADEAKRRKAAKGGA